MNSADDFCSAHLSALNLQVAADESGPTVHRLQAHSPPHTLRVWYANTVISNMQRDSHRQ